ncbi:MAG: hypothetical protein IJN29_01085 [Akkermansia sp.]|nr:hypothetical protein [Akkermansia sp.]
MSNKTKYTWLTSLLTGWGVKECWAKVIAGAIIGALCAAGVLALDGCAVRYSQTASGDIEYTGSIIPVERGCK